MSLKNSLIAVGAITAVAGASMLGGAASAQGSAESISSKIAENFSLDQAEVEAVFQEHRDERRANRQVEAEAHLQSLVDDGTLTEEQKATLQEFRTDMMANRQGIMDQDLSREEARELSSEAKAEFEAWAENEGLNLDDLRSNDGEHKGHGERHHF